MPEIQSHAVYTTEETRVILKISSSTMKRFLKAGLVRANKVGGQYRILGKELLRILSPSVERSAVRTYSRVKYRLKKGTQDW